jgi:ABC-2 type transport system permease protein
MIFLYALQLPKERRTTMRKILIIALREYRAAVKTKSFIVGLILVPVLMGGSMAAFMIFKDNVDTDDLKIAVIDHSQLVREALQERARLRNETEIFDKENGEKIKPAYILEFIQPDSINPFQQKLDLSNRVRSGELHAFVEIGPSILHPDSIQENTMIRYYSEHAFMDDVRYWFSDPVNNHIRQLRLNEMDLAPEETRDLFYWINVEGMGLVEVNKKTGDMQEAEKTNELQSFLVPYFMVLLMFMLVMMSAIPLLTAVMEEKMERIAEVLLASVTPFQFMLGKILGSISISLTIAAIYVAGAILTVHQMDMGDMIPYRILPWFFAFLILFVIMTGSVMAALGSACNDNKDAQNLQFPAMLPVILPLFILVPVMQNPTGNLSTWLSLFPPFTPTLMLVRLATPVTIPAWQPYAGLIVVVLFTILSVWIGGRIFRTGILLQGQKPTLANLISYALKG